MQQKEFEQELLKTFGKNLEKYGFTVQELEADDEQGEAIRCFFAVTPDNGNEEAEISEQDIAAVEIEFMDLDTVPVLQYYFYMKESLPEEQKAALKPVVEECNVVTPLGHMGFFEDDLYYRYTQVFRGNESMDDALQACEDVLSLLLVSLQVNMEDIRKCLI